jgi:hypothetical protein
VLFVSLIYDFVTSDPINYFFREPRQILVVAAIAIAGAALVAGFHRLSPQWRRRVHLLMVAFLASSVTTAIGWTGFLFLRLLHFWDGSDLVMGLALLLFGAAFSTLLWLEFCDVYRKRLP